MKRNLSKKTVTLLVSLMVLAGAAIGGTLLTYPPLGVYS